MRTVHKVILVISLMMLMYTSPIIEANSSGKFNNSSGCSCHNSGSVTATLSGQPSQYTPGQSYSLNVGMSGGVAGTKGGFSLTVNKGSLSNPGTNAQVNAQSDSATHSNKNSRAWTVDWTAPTGGSGTVNFALAVLSANNNGQNSGDQYGTNSWSVPEQVSNSPPSVSNVLISPSNPKTTDSLILTYSYFDTDGDAESGSTIEWSMNGSVQAALSGQSTVSSSLTSKGQSWTVSVIPSDGTDPGSEVISSSVSVINSAPTIASATLGPADADDGDELSLTFPAANDADSDQVNTSIRWYLDGGHVSELDDQTTVSSWMTRSGDVWHVELTPNDGITAGPITTSNSLNIESSNNPPTSIGVGVLPTSPTTSDDLTAQWTFDDQDGQSQASFNLRWSKDGLEQPQWADHIILPSSATSKGQSWEMEVRVNDGITWSDWTASPVVTVVNTAPESSDLVITPMVPKTADDLDPSWSFSDLDGDVEGATIIKWYRDGIEQIAWQGSDPLPASATTKGEVWHAEVLASDSDVLGVPRASDPVTIANTAPSVVDLIFVSGAENSTTDISIGWTYGDADGDPEGLTEITWYLDGAKQSLYDGLTVLPAAALAPGDVWHFEIKPDDGDEFGSWTASMVVVIANIRPTAALSMTEGAIAGLPILLDATGSSDPDSSIAATLITVDGIAHHSTLVELNLEQGSYIVNVSVLDSFGGMDSIEKILTVSNPILPTGLSVEQQGDQILLSWTATDPDSTYRIYRSFEPIASFDDLAGQSPIAVTTESSWQESVRIHGDVHYALTIESDGQEVLILGQGLTANVEVQPFTEVVEDESIGMPTLIMFILSIIAALGVISINIIDRMSGGGAQ